MIKTLDFLMIPIVKLVRRLETISVSFRAHEVRQAAKSHTAFGLLSFLVLTAIVGCIQNPSSTGISVNGSERKKQESLPIRATIDIGVVFQGEIVQTNWWIRNQSDNPISIAKIEKSCECVDLNFTKIGVLPGKKVLVQITYDAAKEPDFAGALQIEVVLSDESGNKIGLILVSVEVAPKVGANL